MRHSESVRYEFVIHKLKKISRIACVADSHRICPTLSFFFFFLRTSFHFLNSSPLSLMHFDLKLFSSFMTLFSFFFSTLRKKWWERKDYFWKEEKRKETVAKGSFKVNSPNSPNSPCLLWSWETWLVTYRETILCNLWFDKWMSGIFQTVFPLVAYKSPIRVASTQ